VLCSGQVFVKKKVCICLRVTCRLLQRSSPSQVPTTLLTNALMILWLSLHRGDPYTNHLLKDMAIFLCID